MSRVLLSLLLTVNLLVCPLRCASCVGSESVASQSQAAAEEPAEPTCCCCAHQTDTTAPEPPVDQPREDCQCQDCICDGATLQDSPEPPGSAQLAALVMEPPMPAESGNHLVQADQQRHTPLSALGGRGMRIAHRSLLI